MDELGQDDCHLTWSQLGLSVGRTRRKDLWQSVLFLQDQVRPDRRDTLSTFWRVGTLDLPQPR